MLSIKWKLYRNTYLFPVLNEGVPLGDAGHSIKNEKFAVFQIN